MTVFSDATLLTMQTSSPSAKTRLLEQMAEALEDQAAGLYRRAAAFEEEEFLLNKEIGERQTEINRLQLKLDGLRAERDRVADKIERVSSEAAAVRERAFDTGVTESQETMHADPGQYDNPSTGALFFRRMTVADQVPRA
jgi:septal ring factor EnvC (AmiA/AmiB activator)